MMNEKLHAEMLARLDADEPVAREQMAQLRADEVAVMTMLDDPAARAAMSRAAQRVRRGESQ